MNKDAKAHAANRHPDCLCGSSIIPCPIHTPEEQHATLTRLGLTHGLGAPKPSKKRQG